ncbi:MAG: hypothetical protein CM1200mP27_11070 [Chloroflexota bacterium]|nr:MAG: hypothetical protein CM1200mP27_11070 [Chloroflexota bacterium]
MTYRCGLGRADKFAGLAALSATLPIRTSFARLPSERKQPIFIAQGRYDQMVSEDTAHSAKTFLENNGYTLISTFTTWVMRLVVKNWEISFLGWLVLPPKG